MIYSFAFVDLTDEDRDTLFRISKFLFAVHYQIKAKMSTNYVSQWGSDFKEAELTRQSFLDVLDGKIPFVRDAEFVSRDVAQKLEDIYSPQLAPYIHATGPQLFKVGVAQFEFQALSQADLQNRSSDGMPSPKA